MKNLWELSVLFLQLFCKSEVISKKKKRMWKLSKCPVQSWTVRLRCSGEAGPGPGCELSHHPQQGEHRCQGLDTAPSSGCPGDCTLQKCQSTALGLRMDSLTALLWDTPSSSSVPLSTTFQNPIEFQGHLVGLGHLTIMLSQLTATLSNP